MSDPVIRVKGLSKRYTIGTAKPTGRTLAGTISGLFRKPAGDPVPKTSFWALRDVNFDIHRGEVVGIIGRNGAGKSTLLKILSRITDPTEGGVDITGRIGSLLEVGTGFHPELTGRENVFLNGAILGMRRAEIAAKFDEIVAFAETEKFLDTPVKHYSSGMYTRLAFAVAAHLEPEILIVDEVLAVGDAAFQKKCLGKMKDVAGQGRTVIFVSHNTAAILQLCDTCIMMEGGRCVDQGPARTVIGRYLNVGRKQQDVVDLGAVKRPDSFGRRATLQSVRLVQDGHGETGGGWTLPFGTPVVLDIGVDVTAPVPSLEAEIAVYAASGFEIATTASSHSLPDSFVTAGRYNFRATFRGLKLSPGTYTIGIGLRGDRLAEDHLPEACRIEVQISEEGAKARVQNMGGAIVANADFALTPVADSAVAAAG